MIDKTTDEICEKIGEIMGNEIREMAGYGCLGVIGQKKISDQLKLLACAIKRDLFKELNR